MHTPCFDIVGRVDLVDSPEQCRHIPAPGWNVPLLLLLTLLLVAPMAMAQAPAPHAAPDLELRSNGSVYAMARQPNGGLILGGDFTLVDGTARQNLARLRPDGSLDPDWNIPVDGPVLALAADGNNAVYVGGFFDQVGSFTRYGLAKIQPNGAVHPGWQPQPNGTVLALAVDAAGTVYAGGYFEQIGGHGSMSGVAKIAGGTGNVDMGWNPCSNGCGVHSLALVDGSLYVGGSFGQMGGQGRENLAKLSLATGAADPFWDAPVDGHVLALAYDGNGSLYVGGRYTQIGGESRTNLAKIDANNSGAADPLWNPPSVRAIAALALDGNGHVYAGGGGLASHIMGQMDNSLIRVQGHGQHSGERKYVKHFQARLRETAKTWFSRNALSNEPTEAALVTVVISRSGELEGINLIQSSGSEHFDQVLIDLIRSRAPYPPLPNDATYDVLHITRQIGIDAGMLTFDGRGRRPTD